MDRYKQPNSINVSIMLYIFNKTYQIFITIIYQTNIVKDILIFVISILISPNSIIIKTLTTCAGVNGQFLIARYRVQLVQKTFSLLF